MKHRCRCDIDRNIASPLQVLVELDAVVVLAVDSSLLQVLVELDAVVVLAVDSSLLQVASLLEEPDAVVAASVDCCQN